MLTMPQYNIIYTSPHDEPFLWNGASLDKLEKSGQEVLRYSGKVFSDGELDEAVAACKKAAQVMFPDDKYLKVNTVEVKVV
jgi:hypothetical protein